MTSTQNLKLYFPNLNGLRFIGTFLVIINHIEQMKNFYKIGDAIVSNFAKIIGKLGVMLFSILTDFLSIYLLLFEEKSFGKIHAKKFYIRPFLRIVPLYGLLLVLVFFLIPYFSLLKIPGLNNPLDKNFNEILLLHFLFVPNLATAISGFVPYIAQAYFIWPILLKKCKENRLFLMVGIIIVHFIIRLLLSNQLALSIPFRQVLYNYWTHFNIDAIASSGYLTVLLIDKCRFFKLILNTKFFYFITSVVISLLLFAVKVPYFHYQFYVILFGIIVLNLALNDKLKNVLEWKVLNYLGKISYGIYMYHFIVLIPILLFASKIKSTNTILIYALVLTITILIASISYYYFENIFLKKKTNYIFISNDKHVI